MSNILENSNGSIESQISMLKERLVAYACKLAPVPKIGKIDTSKNGKCTLKAGSDSLKKVSFFFENLIWGIYFNCLNSRNVMYVIPNAVLCFIGKILNIIQKQRKLI